MTRSKKYGVWIFRDGEFQRVLDFRFDDEQAVLDEIERFHADYCLFPAIITDGYL